MGLLPQLVNTKDRKPYCKASTKATKEHFQIVPISFNVDTQSNLNSKLEDPKLLSVDYFEESFILDKLSKIHDDIFFSGYHKSTVELSKFKNLFEENHKIKVF